MLTGAVVVALTACEPEQDAADGNADTSNSADSGTNDDASGKDDDSGDNDAESTKAAITSIELTKSGGIAGVQETLTVDTDGNWEYVKARMAPQTGELSGDELETLMDLATDSGITDVGKKSDKQCNDMQTYQLVIEQPKGDELKAHSDECGVSPNEQFDELVKLLSEATPI